MSLQVAVGGFGRGAQGLQDITSVGFQPKAYITWDESDAATVDGYNAEGALCMGCGPSNIGADFDGIDNISTNPLAGSFCTSNLGAANTFGGGSVHTANHNAFLSNGFQLNWLTVPGTVTLLHYMAFGGSDLTNVFGGVTACPAGTGSQTITGVGFQGDAVLIFMGSSFSQTPAGMSLGAAVSSSKRWAVAVSMTGNPSMASLMKAKRYQRTDSVILGMDNTGLEAARADFKGFTSDGFTLNWTTTPGTGFNVAYLVLRTGGQVDVGALTKSTGVAPVTDTITPSINSTAPAGVLLATFGLAATTSISADARVSVGAGDGTNEGCTWLQVTDVTVPTVSKARTVTTKAISISTAPSTTDAEADLTLQATTFKLNWTTNDATAEQILWMCFGSNIPNLLPSVSETVTDTEAVSVAQADCIDIG